MEENNVANEESTVENTTAEASEGTETSEQAKSTAENVNQADAANLDDEQDIEKPFSKILEERKEELQSFILDQEPELQKIINKLMELFEEGKKKDYDHVSMEIIKKVFGEKKQKKVEKAIKALLEREFINEIEYSEIVTKGKKKEFNVINDTAYTFFVPKEDAEKLPYNIFKNSLIKSIKTRCKEFYKATTKLFNPDSINKNELKHPFLEKALIEVVHLENCKKISYEYYDAKKNKIEKSEGYYYPNMSMQIVFLISKVLGKLIYPKLNYFQEQIQKKHNHDFKPEIDASKNVKMTVKDAHCLSLVMLENDSLFDKEYLVLASRIKDVFNFIPTNEVEAIEEKRAKYNEAQHIKQCLQMIVKFMENLQDIIHKDELIKYLHEKMKFSNQIIENSLKRAPAHIRDIQYQGKTYYACSYNLVALFNSIKDVKNRVDLDRVMIVCYMIETFFELVEKKNLRPNQLPNFLRIDPSEKDNLLQEVQSTISKINELKKKSATSQAETKSDTSILDKIFHFLFGANKSNKKTEGKKTYKESMAEFNENVRILIGFFNNYKRPCELEKFPKDLKTKLGDENLSKFVSELIGKQILRKIKASGQRIGNLTYYVPYSFLTSENKYNMMLDSIDQKVKINDIKNALIDAVGREYAKVKGKMKK